jgi:putative FmdB family regulatory protein
MPIYEYRLTKDQCADCGEGFSTMRKLSDPPLANCPKCGLPCEKIVSLFAVGKTNSYKESLEPTQSINSSETQNTSSHNHDCSSHGCHGAKIRQKYLKTI